MPMPVEIKFELERREKVREMIAKAENLYAHDYEFLLVRTLPTFTEESARQYLQERSTFMRRWVPSRLQAVTA
jgi:hypothetical protein